MNDYFTILIDDTSEIKDYSLELKDFIANTVQASLADSHYLYAGYYKPFSQFYVEYAVANTIANVPAFEYYNGTTWEPLTVVDESEGATKSGFIYFTKPEDWALTTIDSKEKFYIRLQPSVSYSAGTEYQGINVLLSNDLDLIGIKSNIVSKLNNGNSWIEKHEAARKHIIQKLRNLGYRKATEVGGDNPVFSDLNGTTLYYSDLNAQDLLEPFELREASKFYALSYIYLDELSDEIDDKYERAGLRHLERADEAVNVYMLKLDQDDDGEEDSNENSGNTTTKLSWK